MNEINRLTTWFSQRTRLSGNDILVSTYSMWHTVYHKPNDSLPKAIIFLSSRFSNKSDFAEVLSECSTRFSSTMSKKHPLTDTLNKETRHQNGRRVNSNSLIDIFDGYWSQNMLTTDLVGGLPKILDFDSPSLWTAPVLSYQAIEYHWSSISKNRKDTDQADNGWFNQSLLISCKN